MRATPAGLPMRRWGAFDIEASVLVGEGEADTISNLQIGMQWGQKKTVSAPTEIARYAQQYGEYPGPIHKEANGTRINSSSC